MEWQPIETAPRDGTEIIILNFSGRVFRGKCKPEDEEDNEWWEEYNSLTIYHDPTHWMPLPRITT